MSTEIIKQNFNSKIEQVQGKTEEIPFEKQCDLNQSGIERTDNSPVKEESTKNVENSEPASCDSGQSGALNMDQNLNTFQTWPVIRNPKEQTGDCDSCSIIENITNSLSEKESIKKVNNELSNTYNNSDTKVSKKSVKPSAEKLIRDTLIHKVNELDISGRVNQNVQNNESTVILKKETDSLKKLLVYDNSSDDDDDFEKDWQLFNVPDSVSDSESSSNDWIESSSDDDADDVSSDTIFVQKDTGAIKKGTSKPKNPTKSFTDLHNDLPPIPDLSNLNINYEKEEFLHMGHVQAIIDTLVTVEAIPGTPAYDLDSCLFIDDKTTKRLMGAVYDVIGPVTAPIYCIRFTTEQEIKDLNLKQGLKVYSAPKSQHTKYVFLAELMKYKGSDASWVGDTELPPEVAAEMSDEEDEHNLQNARKAQKRKHGSLERHKEFEKSMNRCNTINTRVAQLVDAHRRPPRSIGYNDNSQRLPRSEFCSFSNRVPAPFDPTVPPPGFHCYPRESNMPNNRPPAQWSWMYRAPVQLPNSPPFTQGQNNSGNYYRNNVGRNHAAGPSTQP